MAGSENGQEQDITAELCISPKISDDDNSNSSGSSSIEKNVDENAMDLIFSSANAENGRRSVTSFIIPHRHGRLFYPLIL